MSKEENFGDYIRKAREAKELPLRNVAAHLKLIKRVIFGGGKGKDKIYLSIDFETGGFEVCNYLGEHIGEYFFDGIEISGKKAGHNIKVKS